MKKLLVIMALVLFIPITTHAEIIRLEWANDEGRENVIDWEIASHVIDYAFQSKYIGFSGRREHGQVLRFTVLNMTDNPIFFIFPFDIVWEGFSVNHFEALPPHSTREYRFYITVKSDGNGRTEKETRGSIIWN